jgi:hypothetical protein
VPPRGWSAVRIIRLLAAQSSRNYVYSAERPDHLMARMDGLQIRVTALEGRVKEVQPGGRTI